MNGLDHAVARVLVEGRSLLECREEVASMQDVDNIRSYQARKTGIREVIMPDESGMYALSNTDEFVKKQFPISVSTRRQRESRRVVAAYSPDPPSFCLVTQSCVSHSA